MNSIFDPIREAEKGRPTDGGFMINVPNAFGFIFLWDGEEDLDFVSRGPGSALQDESD